MQTQWNLDRLDNRQLGTLDGLFDPRGLDGSDVTVYVLDTGVLTTHTEFGGRASFGADITGGGSTTDPNGHGTHVRRWKW
jgi:subtilisin family serine protease